MDKRVFLSVLLLVVLFTTMTLMAFEGQSWREPRNRIRTYLDTYGEIIFGAIYSLPETQEIFVKVVGDRAWSSYSAKYVSGELSGNEKKDVVDAVSSALNNMSLKEQDDYFERLGMWLTARKALSYSYSLACIESTMGAVYSIPDTQPLFEWVLENRGFDPQISGIEVGATLASGEISGIEYELLNILSGLSRKDQMAYFRTLFDKLLTDPDLSECLSLPDVDFPSSGEQE